MSFSPKFSLAVIRSSLFDPSSEVESFLRGEPLIPGLPEDVAFNCLLRLPIPSHAACRAVCKSWYLVLGDKERFFSRRKESRLENPWLFVFASHECTGKIQWQALDLVNFSWHTIPAMPCKDKALPYGLRCGSLSKEGILFVCGSMLSDVDCPLDSVLKYEILKNRWTVTNKMTAARSFFASGVINGRIYVAEGMSLNFFELASGEVFDPVDGTWREIASMGTGMTSYDAVVLNGKLLVMEGWLWHFYVSPRGLVYNPVANKWENISVKLREGWTGSSTVIYGHLFAVAELESMKLKVYDEVSDSWEEIDGPPLLGRYASLLQLARTVDQSTSWDGI